MSNFSLNLSPSNWIAIAALCVSLYNLWKGRKTFRVSWDADIQEADIAHVIGVIDDEITGTYDYAYTASVSLINPSPNDIAFFDLHAFNAQTGQRVNLITKKTFAYQEQNQTIYQVFDNHYARLDIPDSKYGVCKANTYNRLDLVVVLPDISISLDQLALSFKTTKKSWLFKDKFAGKTFKKFKNYQKIYEINGWQSRRKKQQQELDIPEERVDSSQSESQ